VVLLVLAQVWTSGGIGRSHADHIAGIEPASYDLLLHELHTFGGLAIFGLVVLRILMRLVFGAPSAPRNVHRFIQMLAVANHLALYAVLLALPAIGLLARYIDFDIFGPVHVALTRLLLVLVAAHIAAALWHMLIRRDAVVSRMLPG
jgi:cytochrome b561